MTPIKNLEPPKNQWALAVYYLIFYGSKGFSMKDACPDFFYKIQTRLGEVSKGREGKIKVLRTPMTTKNRFKHVMNYTHYKSLADKHYLIGLYNKLNKLGSKALHK